MTGHSTFWPFMGHVFTIPCFFCAALVKAPRAPFKALKI